MRQAELVFSAPSILKLSGSLDFSTSVFLQRQGIEWLNKELISEIDLTEVIGANSAGLALLLAWQSEALRLGRKLSFSNLPECLVAAADLYGVSELLATKGNS